MTEDGGRYNPQSASITFVSSCSVSDCLWTGSQPEAAEGFVLTDSVRLWRLLQNAALLDPLLICRRDTGTCASLHVTVSHRNQKLFSLSKNHQNIWLSCFQTSCYVTQSTSWNLKCAIDFGKKNFFKCWLSSCPWNAGSIPGDSTRIWTIHWTPCALNVAACP